MASLTKSDLLDAVAAKMDIQSADYTTAQQSEVQQWALDCLRWLMPLAPEYAITSVVESATNEGEPYTIASDCLKIVRVSHYTDGDLVKYLEPTAFTRIKNAYSSGTNSYETGFRIWSDIMGTVNVFRIDAADTISVDYIKEPAWGDALYRKKAATSQSFELRLGHVSVGTGDDSEPPGGAHYAVFWSEVTYSAAHTEWEAGGATYSGNELTIPNGWAGLIGSYCAIHAKMKDEEPQQAQAHWQMFMQELSRFRGFEDIAKSIGG